jgi:hypothetical protein
VLEITLSESVRKDERKRSPRNASCFALHARELKWFLAMGFSSAVSKKVEQLRVNGWLICGH